MRIATYNIMSGGFSTYTYDYSVPDRLNLLKKAIKIINADFIGLVDTFRWKDVFTERDLIKLFGYKRVFHVNMNDARVDKKIGITVMTNLLVKNFENVRLYNRDCIKTTVIDKEKLVDVFTVYLDDISEDTRLNEVGDLLRSTGNNPTVVMGDFNAIDYGDKKKTDQRFKKYLQKNSDLINTKDYRSYFKPVIKDMFRVEVIKLMQTKGLYKEANNKDAHLSTFPTKLNFFKMKEPLLRVDHIFVSSNLGIKNFEIYSKDLFEKTSDHYPILASIH